MDALIAVSGHVFVEIESCGKNYAACFIGTSIKLTCRIFVIFCGALMIRFFPRTDTRFAIEQGQYLT